MATNENACSLQTQPMKTFVVSASELEVRRLSTVWSDPLKVTRNAFVLARTVTRTVFYSTVLSYT